jgi:agmatinase
MTRLGNLFDARAHESTFLGFPSCDDLAAMEADIAVIGVPVATPYPSLGLYAADSPTAIRRGVADFAGAIGHQDLALGGPLLPEGVRVVDCGDLPGSADDGRGNRALIAASVREVLDAGAVPVVLGGDDSIPIPVFQAFEDLGSFTVVQVDAHIDWRDAVDGERFGLSSTMRRAAEMHWVERIVQVGARGPGSARPADYRAALDFGAHIVTAREVQEHGMQPVIDLVPVGSQVLFTIDCDGLDPSIMPAVIGPAPGGLGYWQVLSLLEGVAARARIACFDIVELMPERDRDGIAALTAGRLVCNALGLIARQRAGNA